MADDPNKRDFPDRNRAAADQQHEVQNFAEQNGLSRSQALALIGRYGNDREMLKREAKRCALRPPTFASMRYRWG